MSEEGRDEKTKLSFDWWPDQEWNWNDLLQRWSERTLRVAFLFFKSLPRWCAGVYWKRKVIYHRLEGPLFSLGKDSEIEWNGVLTTSREVTDTLDNIRWWHTQKTPSRNSHTNDLKVLNPSHVMWYIKALESNTTNGDKCLQRLLSVQCNVGQTRISQRRECWRFRHLYGDVFLLSAVMESERREKKQTCTEQRRVVKAFMRTEASHKIITICV